MTLLQENQRAVPQSSMKGCVTTVPDTSPGTSPEASLEKDELAMGMSGGEAAKGYQPGVEGMSTGEQLEEQLAKLETGEHS